MKPIIAITVLIIIVSACGGPERDFAARQCAREIECRIVESVDQETCEALHRNIYRTVYDDVSALAEAAFDACNALESCEAYIVCGDVWSGDY